MEEISNILEQFGLGGEAITEFSQSLSARTIAKNEYFVRYKEKMDRIGILYKGILVSRYCSEDGQEITSKIYHPKGDNIVVDYYSFLKQLDSSEEIQAVEDSKLLVLKHRDLDRLVKSYPQLQELVTNFSDQSYLKALDRIRDFQLLKARERVEKFIYKYGETAARIKIRDKASYLGMSRNVFTESVKKL